MSEPGRCAQSATHVLVVGVQASRSIRWHCSRLALSTMRGIAAFGRPMLWPVRSHETSAQPRCSAVRRGWWRMLHRIVYGVVRRSVVLFVGLEICASVCKANFYVFYLHV